MKSWHRDGSKPFSRVANIVKLTGFKLCKLCTQSLDNLGSSTQSVLVLVARMLYSLQFRRPRRGPVCTPGPGTSSDRLGSRQLALPVQPAGVCTPDSEVANRDGEVQSAASATGSESELTAISTVSESDEPASERPRRLTSTTVTVTSGKHIYRLRTCTLNGNRPS